MIRTGVKCLLAATAAGAFVLTSVMPASADTIAGVTTCTNAFTAPQVGPSSFDVQIPATAVVGETVPVTVTFTFTNQSGYNLTDANSGTQRIATTGTAENPITVTAGSTGPVANGASVLVTETGTWTPDQPGTATFTLGDFSFNTVVFGFTVPVSCTFNSTPAAVSSVVS
jgi:hypothetical protein